MKEFNPFKNPTIFVMSLVAFTFVIVAIVSAFFTYKASDIKREQQKLIENNILLSQNIAEKKEEYDRIQDKIEEIEELTGVSNKTINQDLASMLKTLSPHSRQLIIDSLPSGMPVESNRITSSFGYRIHPILNERRFHHGIDFGGAVGLAITATADGIVEFADFDKGYGNLVVIHHNFGFKTAYGHMLDNLAVKKGDFVRKGDVIGYLGSTGLSTGPHLHYEIKYIKNVLDPKPFLTFSLERFDQVFLAQSRIGWENLIRAVMSQYGRVGLAKL